jgi:hypothetical protein
MVSSINSALLGYLSTQGQDSSKAAASSGKSATTTLSPAAMQRVSGMTRNASAIQALDNRQKALSADLRAAMEKAGVKLSGAIEFTIKSDGSVDVKGSEADKAATQAFLKADTGRPSFANRIATQAKEALQLSTTLQQSAAISQAAKAARSTGGVMALYTSLMQQAGTASVSFSVSATASTLTYPGSLTARA